jgi:hypothetical protein
MEINDLTPAEERVWRAFPRGEAVDFREAADEDAEHSGGWGPERSVRATVLRAHRSSVLLPRPWVLGLPRASRPVDS